MQRVLAAVLLVALFPFGLILAIAVKLTSAGPVFYHGPRLGLHQKEFQILKFRTLRVDAETSIGGRLLHASDGMFTPLGGFLKRSKLDELPQLWNIIRGEMAFVGPRPCRPVFLEQWQCLQGYGDHFALRPGVTGIAQLRGGYYTPIEQKLRYERLYLHRRSPLLDIYLMALTLVKALGRWLTPTLTVAGLFLAVSWAPARLVEASYVTVGGDRISLLHLCFLLVGLLVLRRDTRISRIHYRFSAQDRVLGLWLGWCVLAVLAAGHRWFEAARSLGYLAVTGLLPYTLLANTAVRRLSYRHLAALVLVIGLGAGALFLPGLLAAALAGSAGTALAALARILQPGAGGRTAVVIACVALLRYFAGTFGPQRHAWRLMVRAGFVLAVVWLSWQSWEFSMAVLASLLLQWTLTAPARRSGWEPLLWLLPAAGLARQIHAGMAHAPGAIWTGTPQGWHWLWGNGYPLAYTMQLQVGVFGRMLFAYGVPGLVLFIAFWVSFARLAVRGCRELEPVNRDLVVALLSSVAGALLLMLWQPLLYDPPSQVCVWMAAGIATGCITRFSPSALYSTVRWKLADHGDDFRPQAKAARASGA